MGGQFGLTATKTVTRNDEALENIKDTIDHDHPVGTPESDHLGELDGKGVLGVWTLHFEDTYEGDGGFLYSLYFHVTCAP